jgi:hypothetical protein
MNKLDYGMEKRDLLLLEEIRCGMREEDSFQDIELGDACFLDAGTQ